MTGTEAMKHYRHQATINLVPDHLVEGLVRYIVQGIPPGHFMTAVLSNDLAEAVSRGDDASRAGLVALVTFLYNYAPSRCWGTPARVDKWDGLSKDEVTA